MTNLTWSGEKVGRFEKDNYGDSNAENMGEVVLIDDVIHKTVSSY